MFIYIFIAVLITAWIWLCYEVTRAPLENEEDINDPTTTCWHDDDEHYPDSKF